MGYDCGSGLMYLAIEGAVSARLMTALLEEGFDPGTDTDDVTAALDHALRKGRLHLVDAILGWTRQHGRLEEALTRCFDRLRACYTHRWCGWWCSRARSSRSGT